jgi:hypothetical protein
MNSADQNYSFENLDRQKIGDQQSNPQLNFVDIANENGGSLSNLAKGTQTADAYLPNLSIEGMAGPATSSDHPFDWGGANGLRFNDSASGGQALDWAPNNANNLRSWNGGPSNDSAIPLSQSFQGLQGGGDSGMNTAQGLQTVQNYLSQLNGGMQPSESGMNTAPGQTLASDSSGSATLQSDITQIQQDFQQIMQGLQQLANEYSNFGNGMSATPPVESTATPSSSSAPPSEVLANPTSTDNPTQAMQATNPTSTDNPTQAMQATNPTSTDNPTQAMQATNPTSTDNPTQAMQATNPTSTDNSTPTDTNQTGSTSGFQTTNGQITYDGKLLSGVAVTGEYVQSVGPQAAASTIASDFPGINVVRLATSPDGGAFTNGSALAGGESVSDIDQAIQAFNAKGIGVIVDNHPNDSSTPNNVGSDGAEPAWFGQLAADNVNNNNVMFQTQNEPTADNGGADVAQITQEQQNVYNAVRGAGFQGVVAFEAGGGNWAGPFQSDASTYNGDSNYAIDLHMYAGNSSNASNFEQQINPSIHEANGSQVPVYLGETGIGSSSTQTPDSTDQTSLNAAWTDGTGAVAWLFDGSATGFSDPNHLTNSDGSLTPYGQDVAGLIQQGAS